MLQQVAYNNSEFVYIKPSLTCVRWYLELKRIDENIENHIREIEALKQSPEMLIEELYSWVLKRSQELTSPTDITESLDAIRRTLKKGGGMSASAKIAAQQYLYELLLPFCQFDEKAFTEAFRTAYPANGLSNTIKQKELALEKFRKQRDIHLAKAKEHVLDNVKQPATLISKYVSTWRSRVSSYDAPVTIDGVAIHTLPKETRKIYEDAYKAMGFDKVPKSLPRLAHKNARPVQTTNKLLTTPPNAPIES